MFLLIDLRWRDSEVLKAGYWLIGRELLTTDSVKRTNNLTLQTRNKQASKPNRSLKSAALQRCYAIQSETRYTVTTNLEEHASHLAPFAIERSRGVIEISVVSSAAFRLVFKRVRAIDRRLC